MIRRDLARVTTLQFTRPRGVRRDPRGAEDLSVVVSIHAPTGGATIFDLLPPGVKMFQFTRPRGARRGTSRKSVFHVVSIHAPTGGATDFPAGCARAQCFNSRAHGGRDKVPVPDYYLDLLFQFTRPRGARPAPSLSKEFIEVSIHVPTGGATDDWLTGKASAQAFQFTRPRGARHAG